ncbi:MAG: nicotinate-nucleotide diphosphorylase (carboxylating) [bacterium (Candidatus Ratteibacteria) CG_4_10_14_3_um_filter_41_18]|uniref:Probable nicotinate-nucleotide pyrophosphorylase [carboxylating] n=4 Tax=Candidatus Ratteibacteria TaxID=2979319 RepID=A0A2M7E9I0_9BACT|nr:MAG: nicotinate-nucleotide diphosphorylase (carboxylating) [Candidatus Omnitrophica bacterium CG1_02_41_171]PIV64364.1 MAG: nicotinate-nucleotide diphosphorylase (carboxylating) [bacterium (Candidatus Ratteibacteria) CG01_land_8_20_14_3_00_40_19]PIW33974.1 MAG: nicotinate-nucleotide diphosphorylase (carboxylating) [bacterium (Candidatus Ratteibacteria) CG15_BIG_FIL_POST_REV_8_21_14_020_41_12]PIX76871.1 MAG: nicotinate-nucleotide diphosphorylase (carboxylating) [bacterium (Candidatus Ratteibac
MKINQEIKDLIKRALDEDIGEGDRTTKILFPMAKKVKAIILAKEKGIIAGLPIAKLSFKTLDKKIKFIPRVKEGEEVKANQIVAELVGNCAGLLAGERVALNFLSHLSGIATLTDLLVKKVKNRVKIMDTRKTLPGLRILEKYAVKTGGGKNHRFGLFDGILIKDNHIEIATSSAEKSELLAMTPKLKIQVIEELILTAKKEAKKMKVEVEVENYQEALTAIRTGADIIMLDNMKPATIRKIVKFAKNLPKKPIFEISGGITLENISQFASLGIDRISLGALTHSAPALDLGMEIT